MSILNTVTTGVTQGGLRMVIAGQEKQGKTTLASFAPNALLIPLEVGYSGVSVAKTGMLQTYDEVVTLMNEIVTLCQQGQFPYRTIIFDSATALERHIHEHVLRMDPAYRPGAAKTTTMESGHGGYGKAYSIANDVFSTFLKTLDQIAVFGGVNIILTCHVFSSKVQDATVGEFDSWDLLLHSPKNAKTYGKREMITQWADVVGYLYEPMYVMTSEKAGITRAVSANKGRVLGISRTPAYTAGNRYGLVGELPIPQPPENGWNHFAGPLYQKTGIDLFTR